jgi:glycerophosphoryl diester phosphodiesterase
MQSSPSGPDPLDPGPKGFAHRGLHYGAGFPENSLLAFAAALEFGSGIECDLRLTADDRILIFHDRDTWRMCSSHLFVGRSTHAELSRLRVGEGPIPTLESLLELVKGRVPLLLEVKVDHDIWRWMPALKRALRDYRGRHGIMSFDPRVGRLLKSRFPKVRRGLVIKDSLSPLRRRMALWLADPHFIAVERTALGKSWVARERSRRPVYSWTIKGPQQRAQAAVHADALIWEGDGRPGN